MAVGVNFKSASIDSRGQLRQLCCDYDYLLLTLSTLCKKPRQAPRDTICSTPPFSSRPFRSVSEVTFPCHQRSVSYPCLLSSVTLVTPPVFPVLSGVNVLTSKQPCTLGEVAVIPAVKQEQWTVALEPAQCLINVTMESYICSSNHGCSFIPSGSCSPRHHQTCHPHTGVAELDFVLNL